MKAKLSSASGSKAGTPPKPSASGQQGARAPGGAVPSGAPAAQGANGPGPAGGAAPADQRQSLPPLTPEEMRRQYAGACDAGWGPDVLGRSWGSWGTAHACSCCSLQQGERPGTPPLPVARLPACSPRLRSPQIRCRCCGTCRSTRSRRCLCASCTSAPSPLTSRVRAAAAGIPSASTPWLPPRLLLCRAAAPGRALHVYGPVTRAAAAAAVVLRARRRGNLPGPAAVLPPARDTHRLCACRPVGACAGEGDQAADAAGDGGLCQLGQRQVHGAGAAALRRCPQSWHERG